jgi:Family of unknown function (DUF5677)
LLPNSYVVDSRPPQAEQPDESSVNEQVFLDPASNGWFEELFYNSLNTLDDDAREKFLRLIDANPDAGELRGIIEEMLRSFRDSGVPMIADDLDRAMPDLLKWRHRTYRGFDRRLRRHWGEGFDRLETMVHAFWEVGAEFLAMAKSDQRRRSDPTFRCLARLFARATRTAEESFVLLRTGFADGALARWRTLYELAITAEFIAEGGGDTAKRYLAHEEFQAMRTEEISAQYDDEGETEASREILEGFVRRRVELVAEYGRSFLGEFGWAAESLNHPAPRFSDIEAACDFSSARPLYRRASAFVHAGADGLVGHGVLPHYRHLLLPGRSNAGLSEPGQLTAMAIGLLAGVPGRYLPTVGWMVRGNILNVMATRCCEAFERGEASLLAADRELPLVPSYEDDLR